MPVEQVWIADDDSAIRWVLERALSGAGYQVRSFDAGQPLLDALAGGEPPQIIVSDIRMPGTDGLAMMSAIKQQHPDLPVIIMTAHSDLDSAVNAYQQGAFEYLPKPFDIDEAIATIERAVESLAPKSTPDNSQPEGKSPPAGLIGEAPAMQEVFRAIGRLSRSSISVLINGESGSGKELVAQALHQHSPRATKPFIALNMAAIPHDLIESELFGHEKGAFTGAGGMRKGRFEQADGGTLFLDEIGDMPLDVQTRLLRVLADGQFYRVGGHEPRSSDVRIIAATHQDLQSRVEQGQFREDLFHRLNVIRIQLPPLRERREDIPALAQLFLQRSAAELNVEIKQLSPAAQSLLCDFNWPGNVRQLENVCRWLTVMATAQDVLPTDLPAEVQQYQGRSAEPQASALRSAPAPVSATGQQQGQPPVIGLHDEPADSPTTSSRAEPAAGSGLSVGDNSSQGWQLALAGWARQQLQQGHEQLLTQALPAFERVLIDAALSHSQGHKQEAARLLGWGRNTLTRKLKELGETHS